MPTPKNNKLFLYKRSKKNIVPKPKIYGGEQYEKKDPIIKIGKE